MPRRSANPKPMQLDLFKPPAAPRSTPSRAARAPAAVRAVAAQNQAQATRAADWPLGTPARAAA
jgi:hypothetical protein